MEKSPLAVQLGIGDDGQIIFKTNAVREPPHRTARADEVPELPGAVQRGRIVINVIVKRILSRNILSIEKSCAFPFNNNLPGLLRLQTKIGWHCCKHFLSATVPICLCFSFSPLNIYT